MNPFIVPAVGLTLGVASSFSGKSARDAQQRAYEQEIAQRNKEFEWQKSVYSEQFGYQKQRDKLDDVRYLLGLSMAKTQMDRDQGRWETMLGRADLGYAAQMEAYDRQVQRTTQQIAYWDSVAKDPTLSTSWPALRERIIGQAAADLKSGQESLIGRGGLIGGQQQELLQNVQGARAGAESMTLEQLARDAGATAASLQYPSAPVYGGVGYTPSPGYLQGLTGFQSSSQRAVAPQLPAYGVNYPSTGTNSRGISDMAYLMGLSAYKGLSSTATDSSTLLRDNWLTSTPGQWTDF